MPGENFDMADRGPARQEDVEGVKERREEGTVSQEMYDLALREAERRWNEAKLVTYSSKKRQEQADIFTGLQYGLKKASIRSKKRLEQKGDRSIEGRAKVQLEEINTEVRIENAGRVQQVVEQFQLVNPEFTDEQAQRLMLALMQPATPLAEEDAGFSIIEAYTYRLLDLADQDNKDDWQVANERLESDLLNDLVRHDPTIDLSNEQVQALKTFIKRSGRASQLRVMHYRQLQSNIVDKAKPPGEWEVGGVLPRSYEDTDELDKTLLLTQNIEVNLLEAEYYERVRILQTHLHKGKSERAMRLQNRSLKMQEAMEVEHVEEVRTAQSNVASSFKKLGKLVGSWALTDVALTTAADSVERGEYDVLASMENVQEKDDGTIQGEVEGTIVEVRRDGIFIEGRKVPGGQLNAISFDEVKVSILADQLQSLILTEETSVRDKLFRYYSDPSFDMKDQRYMTRLQDKKIEEQFELLVPKEVASEYKSLSDLGILKQGYEVDDVIAKRFSIGLRHYAVEEGVTDVRDALQYSDLQALGYYWKEIFREGVDPLYPPKPHLHTLYKQLKKEKKVE